MADLLERLTIYRAQLGGDFIPAEEAQKFVAMMRAQHLTELETWMDESVCRFVTVELGRIRRSERARFHRGTTQSQFAQALAHGGTEEARTTAFDARFIIDANNTERPVKDMTGPDHRFVANRYQERGKKDLLCYQFHLTVEKRIGPLTTKEVLSLTDYQTLRKQIVGD